MPIIRNVFGGTLTVNLSTRTLHLLPDETVDITNDELKAISNLINARYLAVVETTKSEKEKGGSQ